MRDENARPDPVEQGRHGIRVDRRVVWARVGNHLPKELVERFRAAGKLHVLEEVWPRTKAKDSEAHLFVGGAGNRDGLRAATGPTPLRLIDHVDRETTVPCVRMPQP